MGDKSMLFEPLPKGSLSDAIVKRITDALISGELKPGDKIPTEEEFSERLGVGRNAVREAIKVFVAFGVLEIKRARGTYVVSEYNENLMDPLVYGMILSPHSTSDLIDAKVAHTMSLMYLVMRNATDEELDQLDAMVRDYVEASGDPDSSIDECSDLHLRIMDYAAQISHNPMTCKLDQILSRLGAYTVTRGIRKLRKQGKPTDLADELTRCTKLLKSRNEQAIPDFINDRMVIWHSLVED